MVSGYPALNCEGFCCPKGYRYITVTEPRNIACLGGVCTADTCCRTPTCASSYGYWGKCDGFGVLKPGSNNIQCPTTGCNQNLCCY